MRDVFLMRTFAKSGLTNSSLFYLQYKASRGKANKQAPGKKERRRAKSEIYILRKTKTIWLSLISD